MFATSVPVIALRSTPLKTTVDAALLGFSKVVGAEPAIADEVFSQRRSPISTSIV